MLQWVGAALLLCSLPAGGFLAVLADTSFIQMKLSSKVQ